MTKELTTTQKIARQVNTELADPATMRALVATTFNGMNETNVRKACIEAMMRGYTFKDILRKRIYAIPYNKGKSNETYSLVQSIADARAVAMHNGQVGKSAPEYVMNGDKIESCTITVKRKVGDYVGDYTATVYFDEYYKKGNGYSPSQWDIRPKSMIAKVAEMHALRQAFPEHLDQAYVEEEFDKDVMVSEQAEPPITDRFEQAKKATESAKMGNFEKKKPKDAQIVDDDIPIVGMEEEEVLPVIQINEEDKDA